MRPNESEKNKTIFESGLKKVFTVLNCQNLWHYSKIYQIQQFYPPYRTSENCQYGRAWQSRGNLFSALFFVLIQKVTKISRLFFIQRFLPCYFNKTSENSINGNEFELLKPVVDTVHELYLRIYNQ